MKQARKETKAEKQAIKDLAAASMSAAGWTQALLDGEETRFAKAESNAVEQRLSAETVGLVSASDFREKRAALEAEATEKRVREEQEARDAVVEKQQRKKQKRQQREREERRGLSFVEDDD